MHQMLFQLLLIAMTSRTINQIIPAQRINMGGHLLDQPLPTRQVEQIDPFLLIHHWDKPIAKVIDKKI